MKRLFLLCLLVLTVSVGSWAENISGIWKYTLSGTNATIVGTTDVTRTNLIIPSKVDGYPVTAIGDNAFTNCSNLTGLLTIPESVTSIGQYAFYNCSGLTGPLTIPAKVTSIGFAAFQNCSGLTGSLTIPANITRIEDYTFSGCSGFTGSLTIPTKVTSIGRDAFWGCSGLTGALTIPESVTSIGVAAFLNCLRLTGSLTIPTKVTTIESSAFFGCTGLTGSLTIPESVTRIESFAFQGCTGLTGSLTIPESVTSIGKYAFSGCSSLTGSLTIPTKVTSIEDGTFMECPGFSSLTIPENVTSIGQFAFSGCTGLTGSLTIPESVTRIGGAAFQSCSGLTGSLTIPTKVTSIGQFAFSFCSGFTGSLTIPANVASIGQYAFQNCSGLTGSLTIPANVTSIGNSAFVNCGGLQSVTLSSTGNIALGNDLFANCRELRYIDAANLPANLFSGIDVATKFGKRDYTLLYLPQGATLSSDVENVVVGDVCKSFSLRELNGVGRNGYGNFGYEYGTSIIKPFTATSAVYTGKRMPDGGVYTLYLPYDIDLPADVEAYTLSSYGSRTAVFTKHTGTLAAYTPYLLKRVGGSETLALNNTIMPNATVVKAPEYLNNPNAGTVTDTNTGTWKFLGTTNPISNADAAANRLYVLEADKTWRPVKTTTPGGHVRSLRAFLQAPEGYSGAPLAFMLDEGDTTTGLETIEAEVKKENVDIYTIDGRFVGRNYESLPSGLYIIGGKKVYKF